MDTCPGAVDVAGEGRVTLVNAKWTVPGDKAGQVEVRDNAVTPHMKGRAYFAESCTPGRYDHGSYSALKLLGKTLRYTVDLSGAGCGCDAAFYLTSMRQNTLASGCFDYYCDVNSVCGERCAEIDIQNANMHSWQSSLHTAADRAGVGGGYGGGSSWNGPRDWSPKEYGPNATCINTRRPINVAVEFPVDGDGVLAAMRLALSQDGHACTLTLNLGDYAGMRELSTALEAGMTPVVSYWSGDMLWLDGAGVDRHGPCASEKEGPRKEFCCFAGACGACKAKAESNSSCSHTEAHCTACTRLAVWCPADDSMRFLMKSAPLDSPVEGRAGSGGHGLAILLLVATLATAALVASSLVYWAKRQHYSPLVDESSPLHRLGKRAAAMVLIPTDQ